MIRALITAVVEYFLAYHINQKGTYHARVLAWVLFFLASYQLGEYLIYLFPGISLGIRVAYFSTTMLPPLGVYFLQEHTGKQYGHSIIHMVGLIFALLFFINPSVIGTYMISDTGQCIETVYREGYIMNAWAFYYQGTLLYTMGISVIEIYKSEHRKLEELNIDKEFYINTLKQFFVAYVSFNVVSVLITKLYPQFANRLASLMCALAVIVAFIFTNIAFELEFFPKVREKIMMSIKNIR